jgi:hypothetical protein
MNNRYYIFLFSFVLLAEANVVLAQSIYLRPVVSAKFQKQISELSPEKIENVNTNLGIDDGLDGKPGISYEEKLFYAAMVYAEDEKLVLDGIYYLTKILLNHGTGDKNGGQYRIGLNSLMKSAQSTMEISRSKINAAAVTARADHLIESNLNAKQLLKDLGKEKGTKYVEAIAQCWYDPSLEARKKVLELAKGLVPKKPPFPLATYSALCDLVEKPLDDNALYVALSNVLDAYNSLADHNAVQLEK